VRRGDDPGPPDLRLAGFRLWVHGPETVCPERDEDWLRVTAHCGGGGASVWVEGDVVEREDLVRWFDEVDALHRSLSGVARLSPGSRTSRRGWRRGAAGTWGCGWRSHRSM
jgi:hypothetical protein